MPPAASFGLSASFAVLAAGVAVLFILGNVIASRRLGDAPRRTRAIGVRSAAGVVAWMALTGGAAASGVLARFDLRPPPFAALFVATFALSFAIGLGRTGERLARGLPVAALVGFQGFRFPLEVVMHQAAGEGVMPPQMSFSGWNFDIVSGVAALVVGALAFRGRAPRALVVAWNALGAALLTNIVGLALASSPMIHAFGTDPRGVNTFVAYIPFVWLPSVLVGAAVVGHVVVTRRLLADRARAS